MSTIESWDKATGDSSEVQVLANVIGGLKLSELDRAIERSGQNPKKVFEILDKHITMLT